MQWVKQNFFLITLGVISLIFIVMAYFGKISTINVGLITLFVGFLNMLAIYYAPIVAIRIQKNIETFNGEKQRQFHIFKILMATRGYNISPEHVQALNMLDIEFYNVKPIQESWNIYRDHLNSSSEYGANFTEWNKKRVDYLVDLLYSLSKYFDYGFDKVILKKGFYKPIAHGVYELQESTIREEYIELLKGNKALKVELFEPKTTHSHEVKDSTEKVV